MGLWTVGPSEAAPWVMDLEAPTPWIMDPEVPPHWAVDPVYSDPCVMEFMVSLP